MIDGLARTALCSDHELHTSSFVLCWHASRKRPLCRQSPPDISSAISTRPSAIDARSSGFQFLLGSATELEEGGNMMSRTLSAAGFCCCLASLRLLDSSGAYLLNISSAVLEAPFVKNSISAVSVCAHRPVCTHICMCVYKYLHAYMQTNTYTYIPEHLYLHIS